MVWMGFMRDASEWIRALAEAGVVPVPAVKAWGGRREASPVELAAFLRRWALRTPRARDVLAALADSGEPPRRGKWVPALAPLTVAIVAAGAAWAGVRIWRSQDRALATEAVRFGRAAAAREAEGDLAGALASHRAVLALDPANPAAREGRSRARDTLLFAQALADSREALDAGAVRLAAEHARAAEAIWPGNASVRQLLEQAEGIGRLRVASDRPCTLLLRGMNGGGERALSCVRDTDAALPPGSYEVWAVEGGSPPRRLALDLPPHGEARLTFARIGVRPDEAGRGLQAALDRAAPGTVLVLAPGTFTESVRVRTGHLRLEAERPGETEIRAADARADCLHLEGVRGFEADGLVLSGGRAGVAADGGSGLRLRRCAARANDVGLLLIDQEDALVEECELAENREFGLYGRGQGGRIVNCRFVANGGGGLVLERSVDVVVAANVFLRHRRAAIRLVRGQRAEVANNLIVASGQGIAADAAPCVIRHNTCLESRGTGIEAVHRGDQGDLRVFDNLVAFSAGAGLHVRDEEAMGALAASDRNVLWSNGSVAQWTAGRRTETFSSLEEWRRRTDLDRLSSDADPAFEPDGTGRLTPASPFRGAASDGGDAGVDFDGDRPRAMPVEGLSLPEWGRRLLR